MLDAPRSPWVVSASWPVLLLAPATLGVRKARVDAIKEGDDPLLFSLQPRGCVASRGPGAHPPG